MTLRKHNEGCKWHLPCRLQPSNVIEIETYPILPHAFVVVIRHIRINIWRSYQQLWSFNFINLHLWLNIIFLHVDICLFDYYFLVVLDVESLHGGSHLLTLEVVDAAIGIGRATDACITLDDNLSDAGCLVIAGEDVGSGT